MNRLAVALEAMLLAAMLLAAPASAVEIVTLPADSPKLEQIQIAEVKTAQLAAHEVVAPGNVEVIPTLTMRIALPAPGRVSELFVGSGDAVQRDQPLLSIQSPEAEEAVSQFHQAQAQVATAQAGLAKAHSDLDRASDLFAHGAIPKKEVLNAGTVMKQAESSVAAARAGQELATRKLTFLGLNPDSYGQKIVVRAPGTGKVQEMNIAPGEFRGDAGAPVMTLVDLSRVWVAAEVRETQIKNIQIGEPAVATFDAFPDHPYAGKVARLGDVVDPKTRRIQVISEIANADQRLRPGMFGKIKIAGDAQAQPVVPPGAAVQEAGSTFVFVELEPGKFEHREVTLGAPTSAGLPVLGGIQAGDRVVVRGAMLLRGEARGQ